MVLKLRKSRAAAPPRDCALGECLALIGGAWTPHVIWHLAAGPRRFGELRHDMQGVTAKVLSGRLKDLRAKGVVLRAIRPTSPPSVEYELTALGRELVPAIQAIVDIGHRLKTSRPSD